MEYKKGKIVEDIIFDLKVALGEYHPYKRISDDKIEAFLRSLLEKAREVIER